MTHRICPRCEQRIDDEYAAERIRIAFERFKAKGYASMPSPQQVVLWCSPDCKAADLVERIDRFGWDCFSDGTEDARSETDACD